MEQAIGIAELESYSLSCPECKQEVHIFCGKPFEDDNENSTMHVWCGGKYRRGYCRMTEGTSQGVTEVELLSRESVGMHGQKEGLFIDRSGKHATREPCQEREGTHALQESLIEQTVTQVHRGKLTDE